MGYVSFREGTTCIYHNLLVSNVTLYHFNMFFMLRDSMEIDSTIQGFKGKPMSFSHPSSSIMMTSPVKNNHISIHPRKLTF